jgi:hypothetical protein
MYGSTVSKRRLPSLLFLQNLLSDENLKAVVATSVVHPISFNLIQDALSDGSVSFGRETGEKRVLILDD